MLMSEEEMLKGCLANKEKAQQYLFNRYSAKMMGVCLRYANRYDEAQDILQEGFVKVFKKIQMYSGSGSLEGWIRRIMVNTALDFLRSTKNEKKNVSVDEVEYKLEVDESISTSLQTRDLLALIQTLPKGYKTVFNLYAIEGYSHKEIAEQLGVSENTSKSQYSRARVLIQKKLKESDIIVY